jgi:hypothetical protein
MNTPTLAGGQRIQPKDMRCEKRQPLQDLIPLPAPYLLYVDPTSACNFKCAFCPTADLELLKQVGRKAAVMPMELYRKIIADLKGGGSNRLGTDIYPANNVASTVDANQSSPPPSQGIRRQAETIEFI